MVKAESIVSFALLAWSTSASFLLFQRQTQQISSTGSCGILSGVSTSCLGSAQGNCCSRLGFCGSNSSYCGAGCQSSYGECGNAKISTDGSCGGDAGLTCLGAAMGNCCSVNGFCGDTSGHCGTGCQTAFGDCYNSGGTINSTNTATVASGAISSAVATSSVVSSAPAAAATSSNSDATVSAAPEQRDSVTSTAGFKAGMAVMAVAIAGGIFGIGFWLWRRRRQQSAAGAGAAATSTDHKEMHEAMAAGRPQTLHELNGQHHSELDGKQNGWVTAQEAEKPPTYELPGDGQRRDLP